MTCQNKKIPKFLFLAGLLSLSACTNLDTPAQPLEVRAHDTSSAPEPAPAPLDLPPETHPKATFVSRWPFREFLVKGKPAESGFGAYGYVVLTNGFTADTQAYYKRSTELCISYKDTFFEPTSNEENVVDRNLLAVTLWPLTKTLHVPEKENCAKLIQNYDRQLGSQMVWQLNNIKKPLKGRGPFLVAFNRAYQPEKPPTHQEEILIFNLSGITDDQIPGAIADWKNIMQSGQAMDAKLSVLKIKFLTLLALFPNAVKLI